MLLQAGSLPLAPDGKMDHFLEHRCSSVLIWPEGKLPSAENTILCDPCFTMKGLKDAEFKLTHLKLSVQDIKQLFITHRHGDHLPDFPYKEESLIFQENEANSQAGLSVIPCNGHAPDLRALTFLSTTNEHVWIVGDAILDLRWLRTWGYYWPNFYSSAEIVQTWISVANILAHADIIIPGHGEQIFVTSWLIQELFSTFPSAKHAEQCPEVGDILKNRLEQLIADEANNHEETSGQNQ